MLYARLGTSGRVGSSLPARFPTSRSTITPRFRSPSAGRVRLAVTHDGDAHDVCRVVVVASGARHAVRSDSDSGSLTLYLAAAHTAGRRAEHLGSSARSAARYLDRRVAGRELAEATVASLEADGPRAAAEFPCRRAVAGWMIDAHGAAIRSSATTAGDRNRVKPSAGHHLDVASVAEAVALSPDYLGRLCKQQTGVSLSAAIRWERLVSAVGHLLDGRSVTDAAHLAGFADGSHANKVCWEMTGAPPHDFAQAVRASRI